jgi:hypothetical protein
MCKTILATALVVAALGGAMAAVNAAGVQSANSGITGAHRSVPAIYSRPPWIKRHRRSTSR